MILMKSVKKQPPVTAGTLKPGYEEVYEAMKENFINGWEPEGCNFAAFVDGELVVDLWGGFADRSCKRLWDEETLATFFSCSKAITAICFAMQEDAGRLRYSDPISRHWKAFGQNGKEAITIQQALQHQSSLPYFRRPDGTVAKFDQEELFDPLYMDKMVEQQTPVYRPGERSIYHALTFGWIMDGLMRRVDKNGRSVGEFLKEEIVQAKGLKDVFMGGSQPMEYRIARIRSHTRSSMMCIKEWMENIPAITAAAKIYFAPNSVFRKEMLNMAGAKDFELSNHPATRKIGQPAANGVGNARNLAKIIDLFEGGELVSPAALNKFREPTILNKFDPVIGAKINKGNGFMYTRSPLGDWQYGHLGVGGQNLRTDTQHRISFAYITNGMKAGQGEYTHTMKRLEAALYRCYQARKGCLEGRPTTISIDTESCTMIRDINGNATKA